MKRIIVLCSILLLLMPFTALAQDPCEGNFDCDQDVDGTDASVFKSDFGRSGFKNPCPYLGDCPNPWAPCPAGMVVCNNTCVDPLKDKEYCGADSNCIGGIVCGAGQICDGGVCVLNCQPELINCDGMCVDTETNENHCGGCNIPCESGEICIAGSCEIYCSDNYAPVPQTGQTTSYATGDDGDLEMGVAWPNPRFTDNLDGTVTDNLTGLIWLKNANCFAQRTWLNALSDCNGLSAGYCGLTDGSSAGDWRLPNSNELASLVHRGYFSPPVPNTAGTGQWSAGDPFISVQINDYWSSTTYATAHAWYVYMGDGGAYHSPKSSSYYVWPVRGGQ